MDGDNLGQRLWSHSSHGHKQWSHAEVNLTATSGHPLKVSLVATIGAGNGNYLAVDDIVFKVVPSAAEASTPTHTTTPTTTRAPTPAMTVDSNAVYGVVPSATPATAAATATSVADCDFESSDLCGYTQVQNDDMDWQRYSGPTQSSMTGPSADHTLKDRHGHYMYMEASPPIGAPRRKAFLVSPTIDWNSPSSCVSFWYSMYGSTMGTLELKTATPDLHSTGVVWHLSGNQGKGWNQANVTIRSDQAVKIFFQGTLGTNYNSDIAIDDVRVTTGACDKSDLLATAINTDTTVTAATTTAQTPTTTDKLQRPAGYDCDFEANTTCRWRNVHSIDDQLDWTLFQGPTPSSGTGPSADHTLKNPTGHYVYIETSSPALAKPNDTALLVSPTFPGTTTEPGCLRFWYNLHGITIGHLAVYMVDTATQTGYRLWEVEGDHGNHWYPAAMSLFYIKPFVIVIEGRIAGGFYNDMALDDISYTVGSGNCTFTPIGARKTIPRDIHFHLWVTAPPTTQAGGALTSQGVSIPHSQDTGQLPNRTVDLFFSCDFETLCGFQNGPGDFTWARRTGSTQTSSTGPDGDHTPGHNGRGHYVYTEASSHAGGTARFLTKELDASHTDVCLQFYYSMYGASMGTLNVKLLKGTVMQSRPLWSKSGDQHNQWHVAQVNIPASQISQKFKVVFEGVMVKSGSSYQGDMAVDDILVVPKTCPMNGDCSFEMVCGWKNYAHTFDSTQSPAGLSDTGNWLLGGLGASTLPESGGPSDDHTFSNAKGRYVFFMESPAIHQTQNAILLSPTFTNSRHRCMSFWFYFSSSEGVLSVSIYSAQSQPAVTVLWNSYEHSMTTGHWRTDKVPIHMTGTYQILIEAISRSASTLIAIDDIKFQDTSCHSSPKRSLTTTPVTPTPTTTTTTPTTTTTTPTTTTTTPTTTTTMPTTTTTTPTTTTTTPTTTTTTPTTTTTTPTTTTTTPTTTTNTPTTTTTTPTTTTTTPTATTTPTTTTTTPTVTTTTPTTTTTTPTTTTTKPTTTTSTPTTTTTTPTATTTTPTTTTTTPTTTTTTPTTTTTTPTTTTTTPTTTTTTPTTTTTTPTTTTTASTTTTTTPMTTTPAEPNRCQHCGGLQCFTGPVTVQCSTRQPLCFSHVTDMSNGERVVAKGCISQSECDAWTPSDLELKHCLVVDRQVTGHDLDCLFCCHGDLCNKGPNYIPRRDDWVGQNQQALLIG